MTRESRPQFGIDHRRGVRRVLIAGVVAALGLVAPPAALAAPAPSFMRADDCIEHQAFLPGDAGAVQAVLPRGYTATVDPGSGRPLVFVRAERCLVTIGEQSSRATMASLGVVVDSPDGRGCASGAPGAGQAVGTSPPVCNWYPVYWLSSERRIADWLRADAPQFPSVVDPDLTFRVGSADASGDIPFHFAAPPPGPSPFTMDDVGQAAPSAISVRGGYWAGSGAGTLKLAFATDDITPGRASGTVNAAAGSPLAKLLGATQAAYLPSYSAIAAEHWGYGSYRKQAPGRASAGQGFSGSCSLQGTDTFTPPAKNTAQDLHVRYDATGTCTGQLDGHSVDQAAVRWQSTGHAQGSCSQAKTVEPGSAALTFPNGTTIRATLDFTSMLTNVDMDIYGEGSGFAQGDATFATSRTTPQVFADCAGSGARLVPMDLSLTTQSPLVNGDGQSGPGGRARRLRVRARPRATRTRRRTRLSFRVTDGSHHGVRGALVRVAGHRARTNRRGRARLTLRFRRSGRRKVRVTKRGYRSARTFIRVRTRRR